MSKLTPAQNLTILKLAKHCFINMYTDVDLILNATQTEFVAASNIYKELFPEEATDNIDIIAIVIDLYDIYLFENYALNVERQIQGCHNNPNLLHEILRNLELDLKRISVQTFNPSEYMRLFILIKLYTDVLTTELTSIIDLSLLQILEILQSIRSNINRAIGCGLSNHNCMYFTTLRDCNDHISLSYLKLHLDKLRASTAKDVESLQEFSNLISEQAQLILLQHEEHLINRMNLLCEAKLLTALQICVDITIIVTQLPYVLDSKFIEITISTKNLIEMLDENIKKQLEINTYITDLANTLVPKLRESGYLINADSLLQKINALAFWKKYVCGVNLRRILYVKLHAEQEYVKILSSKELLEYYNFVTDNTIGAAIDICIGSPQNDKDRVCIRTHMQRLFEIICKRLDEISPGWDLSLFVSGLLLALIFGVAVGNLFIGLPFVFNEEMRPIYHGGLLDLFSPLALLFGLTSLSMLVQQGALFLQYKLDSKFTEKTKTIVHIAGIAFVVTFISSGIYSGLLVPGLKIAAIKDLNSSLSPLHKTVSMQLNGWLDNYTNHYVLWILPVLAILFTRLAMRLSKHNRPAIGILMSSISIAFAIATAAAALFPFVLPSNVNINHSLTIWDACSSQLTLQLSFFAVVIFLPIVLLYTAWVYRVMRGKVKLQENSY